MPEMIIVTKARPRRDTIPAERGNDILLPDTNRPNIETTLASTGMSDRRTGSNTPTLIKDQSIGGTRSLLQMLSR